MNEFLANLNSLYWWISVVIVGILINLISSYLKSKLDNTLSNVSTWWRKRSKAQSLKREQELNILRSNTHKQVILAFSEIRVRTICLLFFIFGFLFYAFVFALTLIPASNSDLHHSTILRISILATGSIFMLLGLLEWKSAVYKMSLLNEALRGEESIVSK